MKAKRLMIGDWVKHFNGTPMQVTRIDYTQDGGHFACGTPHCWEYNNKFEPIPLTAELLEQNGFKKFNFHDIEGQHQWSWWRDTLSSVSLWCRELNDDPKDGWMIRIESTLATCCHKVEFVHELQQTLRICEIDKEIKF